MQTVVLPLRRDNYAYLLVDPTTHSAAVVDPSDAEPVARALRDRDLRLTAILCTHHHNDHIGGVSELVAEFSPELVVGSRYDAAHRRIPELTNAVSSESSFEVLGHRVSVLETPGHTLGAVVYRFGGVAFTGDTLFLGGCGRVFEGTMEMMVDSLDQIRRLDPATKIYCGHEYTVANLRFASTLDPHNEALRARLDAAVASRASGRPTVPGTLGDERAVNPFLRWDAPPIIDAARRLAQVPDMSRREEIFGVIREAKNHA